MWARYISPLSNDRTALLSWVGSIRSVISCTKPGRIRSFKLSSFKVGLIDLQLFISHAYKYRIRADRRVLKWMEEEEQREVIDEIQETIDFWSEDADLIE